MGVETAMAGGTEQMGDTHVALPQDQVQVRLHAFGTGFTDNAEGRQIHWGMIVVWLVDDRAGIQLVKQEAVVGAVVTAAGDRVGRCGVAGRCFKG
jgi:hypothetical protein